MTLIEIEQMDASHAHNWRKLRFSEVRFNDDGLVVGSRFRILIDGKLLYDSKTGRY